MAAAQVLDMTMEDLQVLVIGHVDRDGVDAGLWVAMRTGPGLPSQMSPPFRQASGSVSDTVTGLSVE